MASTHRLHPQHTGETESDATEVPSAKEKACSSCLEPLSESEKPAFYCNDCDYTVCQSCDNPKSHAAHPHKLYYVCPDPSWSCNVCKSNITADVNGILCYNCEECNFHLCKKCHAAVKTPFHEHTLHRTDVRCISEYDHADGNWACDVCQKTNETGNHFPAHCPQCQYDLCDDCIKPYESTFHEPGHALYRADPTVTYPGSNGRWVCDECRKTDKFPYHCPQCKFDLCKSCMKASCKELKSGDDKNSDNQARAGLNITANGNPVTNENAPQIGIPGSVGTIPECVKCHERPKDATIVHGGSGHMCCCMSCAQELHRTGARCPICLAPIEKVFRTYTT